MYVYLQVNTTLRIDIFTCFLKQNEILSPRYIERCYTVAHLSLLCLGALHDKLVIIAASIVHSLIFNLFREKCSGFFDSAKFTGGCFSILGTIECQFSSYHFYNGRRI